MHLENEVFSVMRHSPHVSDNQNPNRYASISITDLIFIHTYSLQRTHFRWRMRKAPRHAGTNNLTFPVAMRLGDTPVLIPNTMVKTLAADGTMLETAWESRWLPDSYGGVAQLGEHLPCKQGVKSSNLSISIDRSS